MDGLSPDIVLGFFIFLTAAIFALMALEASVLIVLLRRLPEQGQAARTAESAVSAIQETARIAQEVVAGALVDGQIAQAEMTSQLIETLRGYLGVISGMVDRQDSQNQLIADLIAALKIQNDATAAMCNIITRQGAESKADSQALLGEVRRIRRLGGGGE